MARILELLLTGGGALTALLLILLALPQSKLRDFLMPIISWCFALACGAYILMPVDLVPEIALGPLGLIDDAGALVAGILAARSAMTPRQLT